MSIPEFTAQASLYRTSNRYRSSGSEFSGLPPTQSVVAAYYPGRSTQYRCNKCLQPAPSTNVIAWISLLDLSHGGIHRQRYCYTQGASLTQRIVVTNVPE